MIKCVIFDMDGVLTSSSEQHFQAWRELVQAKGKTLDDSIEVYTRGVSRMKSLEIVLESVGLNNQFSDDEKIRMAEEKNERYKELISAFTEDNLAKGAKRFLDDLKSRHIKIALGSASKNGPLLLEKLGIRDYFDYVVNPADSVRPKPAPDIFLKAAQALKISPSNCMGVEDAVAGIASIKAAGMYAVGIGDKNELSQADVVFESFEGLQIDNLL